MKIKKIQFSKNIFLCIRQDRIYASYNEIVERRCGL